MERIGHFFRGHVPMPASRVTFANSKSKELDMMFRNAGFGKSEIHAVPNSKEHVIITQKS